MATIKVACPKCGQKVSGDETFAGAAVSCPVCSSEILFPGAVREGGPTGVLKTETYVPEETMGVEEDSAALPEFEDVAPQARQETQRVASGELIGDKKWREEEDSRVEEEENDELVVPSPVTGAVSLVAGVLGIVFCGIGGILFSPVAIIFGHLSQAKARHSPVQPAPGQTLGAIGMLIGYVWLVITILILGVLVLFEDSIREFIQSRR